MVSFLPRSCFVSLAATLVLAFALAPAAHAQSASFTPVINTLGSGFNSAQNVAVDAHGDVFVANYFDNDVEEIVATNGTVNSSSAVVQVGPVFPNWVQVVAVAQNGDVYVAVSAYGIQVIRAGTGGAAPGTVNANSTVEVIANPATIFGADDSMMVDTVGNLYIGGEDGHIYEIMAGTGGAAPGAITSSSTINTNSAVFNLSGGVNGTPVQIYGLAKDAAGDLFSLTLQVRLLLSPSWLRRTAWSTTLPALSPSQCGLAIPTESLSIPAAISL